MSFYDDEEEEFNRSSRSFSGPVAATIVLVSAAVLVILVLVLAVNNTTTGKNNLKNTQMMSKETPDKAMSALDVANAASYDKNGKSVEELYNDHQLTASDLDFWNMYKDENVIIHSDDSPELGQTPSALPSATPESSITPEPSGTPLPSTSSEPTPTPSPELISGVKENTLDFTNVRIVNEQLHYTLNGNEISKVGVEVSSDNGVVNFQTLKDAGISFVILKVGHRGYDSGVIEKDVNFDKNIKAASEVGLDIGLSFNSRAVTNTEAAEEADYCISQSEGYDIKYPIVFCYDGELFDEARTDVLDEDDLAKMAYAFISQVESKGYNGVLFGNEKYLLEDIDSKEILPRVDVYLNDQTGIPKYPYHFVMWRYMVNVGIQGMEKPGSYTVSFIDYANR